MNLKKLSTLILTGLMIGGMSITAMASEAPKLIEKAPINYSILNDSKAPWNISTYAFVQNIKYADATGTPKEYGSFNISRATNASLGVAQHAVSGTAKVKFQFYKINSGSVGSAIEVHGNVNPLYTSSRYLNSPGRYTVKVTNLGPQLQKAANANIYID